jgi:patatin-like phospholipase/acyl hydrolase
MINALALQGGGCLGYGQTLVLSKLESLAGRPASDLFSFIAGTSVGAIIGAALAAGVPASQIESFFTTDAPVIFKPGAFSWLTSLGGPKYSAAQLQASLQAMLQFKTLSDCKTNFIATAYDFSSDRPVYFKSYEKSWSDHNTIVIGYDNPIQLWQICLASAAAQTYFPGVAIGDMVLCDGGNTSMNAPDVLAIVELLSMTSLDHIKMLSLGTGDSKWSVASTSMVSPSLIRAGLQTIKILFSVGVDVQNGNACKLLGKNYFHLSPDLGDGIALDDVTSCLTKIPPAIDLMLKNCPTTLSNFV